MDVVKRNILLSTEPTLCQELIGHILRGISIGNLYTCLEVNGWKEKLIKTTTKRFLSQGESALRIIELGLLGEKVGHKILW